MASSPVNGRPVPEMEVMIRSDDECETKVPVYRDDTVDDILHSYLALKDCQPSDEQEWLLCHCGALPPGLPTEVGWLNVLMPLTKARAVVQPGEPLRAVRAVDVPCFAPLDLRKAAENAPPGHPLPSPYNERVQRRTSLVCGLLLLQEKLGAPPEVLEAFAMDASVAFVPQHGEKAEFIARRLYPLAYQDAKMAAESLIDVQPARPFIANTIQQEPSRVRCGVCATVKRPGVSPLTSFIRLHLEAGFDALFLFFEEGEEDPDLVALRSQQSLDDRVIIIPDCPSLDEERREACEVWWNRHLPHLQTEIQARQNLNTQVAVCRAHSLGLAWLLHIDIDEAFVCDQPAFEHFGTLPSTVDQVHYLNREAQLEHSDVVDVFKDVTLFKKNPLEGGMQFYAYMDGKAAVRVQAAVECNARPGGSLSFAGFPPSRSRTYDPGHAVILHYPYANAGQFAEKYAWRVNERWNTHPFHRRCLQVASAAATHDTANTASVTKALFLGVVGTEEQRNNWIQAGLCIRDARVQQQLEKTVDDARDNKEASET